MQRQVGPPVLTRDPAFAVATRKPKYHPGSQSLSSGPQIGVDRCPGGFIVFEVVETRIGKTRAACIRTRRTLCSRLTEQAAEAAARQEIADWLAAHGPVPELSNAMPFFHAGDD